MRIGVDLGGTKIEIVAIEGSRERLRRRVATPVGDYGATLAAIVDLVTGVESELGTRGSIGVGHPGVTSPMTGRIKNANSACLIGEDLAGDLERALGRAVRLANDANCLALSEARDGAGADASVVFGVILGTGVGGGLAIDGRLLVGANAIAGEWGHVALHERGPGARACGCGRRGCVEAYVSGPALARDHAERHGVQLEASAIAAAAELGDHDCAATIDRYAEELARGLATVIDIVDPDVIVLGGGLSRISSLYQAVPKLWSEHVFSDEVVTRLVPAKHGDSSGVRGAAWLW